MKREPGSSRAALFAVAACAVALLAAASFAGCGDRAPTPEPPPPAARAHAPGTVLAIGSRELGAPEIDRVAKWIAALYPQSADAHNRRRALTSVLLPQVALAQAHAGARAAALERARAARAELVAGRMPAGVEVREARGTWGTLGLEIFGPALELAPDAWSEPLDALGRVLLLRVREKSAATELGAVELRVELAEFSFVPEGATQASLDADIDTQRLEIVDPQWEQYVPLAWQHRLRGAPRAAAPAGP